MSFQLGKISFKYLCAPMVASRLTMRDCKDLLLNINSKLASWKAKALTYAGRILLIKTVLSSLHIYWDTPFRLPHTIIKAMERKFREFLWFRDNKKPINHVSWKKVCKDKNDGGMGLERILPQNNVVITKYILDISTRQYSFSIWINRLKHRRLAKDFV